MADPNHAIFSDRLQRISKSHRRMAGAYVKLVERDGILVPRAARRPRRGLPLRGLIMTVAVFLLFKGFLLAQLGPITYDSRLAKLADSGTPEQVAAWVMYADPVTVWIADQFSRVM
jgi:hypothetical protein